MQLALALAWLATTVALEARWTPAGDGPARFSKRYRDQQGIGALSAPTLTFHHPCSPCWRCGRRLAVDQRSEKRRRLVDQEIMAFYKAREKLVHDRMARAQ